MHEELNQPIIKAHISYDKIISALDSISSKNSEDLRTLKDLLEEKLPEAISNDDLIKNQTLYCILKNITQVLQQRGID